MDIFMPMSAMTCNNELFNTFIGDVLHLMKKKKYSRCKAIAPWYFGGKEKNRNQWS